MTGQAAHEAGWGIGPAVLVWLILIALLSVYVAAALGQRRLGRAWSAWRTASFALGVGLVAVAAAPWLDHLAHQDLRGHMVQHLLLGMFAPLALVLAAPVTLLLRSLSIRRARGLAAVMRSRPLHYLTRPASALVLDTGALLVLYLTPLFAATLSSPWLHSLVHVHFLAAGYLFAWSIGGPDPAPLRASMRERLMILGIAIAAHSTLAKVMFAYGLPGGTPFGYEQIREAAQVMYYGGDVAELMLATVVFADWYRSRTGDRYRLRTLPRPRRMATLH